MFTENFMTTSSTIGMGQNASNTDNKTFSHINIFSHINVFSHINILNKMVIKTLPLKSILIILNGLNISSAIVHIIVTLVTFHDEKKSDTMLMNYLTMIMSAICCAATVMESSCILQITANIFLSKIVVTIVLCVYRISSSLSLYTFFAMVLHIMITFVAYYMAQRIQMIELNNLISTYTGAAAIPLTPPPHVRSDVI